MLFGQNYELSVKSFFRTKRLTWKTTYIRIRKIVRYVLMNITKKNTFTVKLSRQKLKGSNMEHKNKLLLTITFILTIALFASGCTDIPASENESVESATTEGPVAITVSAAASLTEAFTEMEKEFENDNPDIDVVFNFAASGALRTQIEGGAPVDVFASADQDQMDILQSRGFIYNDTRGDFVENSMVMIVPKGNEPGLTSMEDLTKPEVKNIAIGNPETVPAGKYAKESLINAGLWDSVSGKTLLGENVKQVLVYVERGEADAGFVFRTDASSAQPDTIEVVTTAPVEAPITYPIAVVSSTQHREEAQQFIDFVTGETGSSIMEKYGFTTPQNV